MKGSKNTSITIQCLITRNGSTKAMHYHVMEQTFYIYHNTHQCTLHTIA